MTKGLWGWWGLLVWFLIISWGCFEQWYCVRIRTALKALLFWTFTNSRHHCNGRKLFSHEKLFFDRGVLIFFKFKEVEIQKKANRLRKYLEGKFAKADKCSTHSLLLASKLRRRISSKVTPLLCSQSIFSWSNALRRSSSSRIWSSRAYKMNQN